MLLPFTEKDCLKIIHVRTGQLPHSVERRRIWKDSVRSEGWMETWSGSYCGTSLRGLCSNVTDLRGRYRLQEKFCAFVEWAFGSGGIASLQIIAVGDFSLNSDAVNDRDTRFSICRNGDGAFTFLDGRYGRRDRRLDDYRDFLESCR